MEITFQQSRKRGDSYETRQVTKRPLQVLQMQPMPQGCFVVTHAQGESEMEEAIASVDPVLFLAICTFEDMDGPVVCYGIKDSTIGTITWRNDLETDVYCYGPYIETCKLIGQSHKSFLDWYSEQKAGYSEFDIKLHKPDDVI